MSLQQTTDHRSIREALDPLIEADAVGATILGTILLGLTDSAWCAWDGPSVAVRSGAEWPVALAGPWDEPSALAALVDSVIALGDVSGLSGAVGVVERALVALGRTPTSRTDQRLFRCDELVDPTVPGAWLLAGDPHRHLVRGWWAGFAEEAHAGGHDVTVLADGAVDARLCLLWVDPDGTPVSMAARRPVVHGSARIGPVYTPPSLRGRGYAAGVTAAATRSIMDEGAVPVLFTDLANPVSNGVYRRLGYVPVEDRLFAGF